MNDKKPYTPVIRWIEPGTGSRHQSSLMYSPRRDPTANAAIGNIMREERQKRRREEREEKWREQQTSRRKAALGGVVRPPGARPPGNCNNTQEGKSDDRTEGTQ